MRKTASSRRISSAMASRSASRTVTVTVAPVHAFSSGAACSCDAAAAGRSGLVSATGAGVEGASAGGAAFAAWSTLSPSPAITAIATLTATFSVPSGTRIRASVPSSTASTSIVALSVSISASTSPALTVSPTCLCHLVILPSVMVGDSAGISTAVVIASGLGQHVGPQLRRIGLGAVLGEFRRRGDDVLHRAIELLELRLVDAMVVEQQLAQLVDRIMLRPHPADLFLAAVFRRIGHRMAAIAIGLHLQNVGPLAGPGRLDRLLGR